jgi:hypothetical protein
MGNWNRLNKKEEFSLSYFQDQNNKKILIIEKSIKFIPKNSLTLSVLINRKSIIYFTSFGLLLK